MGRHSALTQHYQHDIQWPVAHVLAITKIRMIHNCYMMFSRTFLVKSGQSRRRRRRQCKFQITGVEVHIIVLRKYRPMSGECILDAHTGCLAISPSTKN